MLNTLPSSTREDNATFTFSATVLRTLLNRSAKSFPSVSESTAKRGRKSSMMFAFVA